MSLCNTANMKVSARFQDHLFIRWHSFSIRENVKSHGWRSSLYACGAACAFVVLFCCFASVEVAAQEVQVVNGQVQVDGETYFRLTNSFLGAERSLETYTHGNNAPVMGTTGQHPWQMWRFIPVGDSYYRLTTKFLGEARALDTYDNDNNEPFMAETQHGLKTGQMWKLTPLGNGYYRLTNNFLGADRSLDTSGGGNNEPMMGTTGNYTGQMWKLTPVDESLVQASASTDFCWSTTWGRGVGTIPTGCGSGQENNAGLCYDQCKNGYTSNGLAGCIQNCPAGATDDGLFCGWPSYKAAEYPIWDENRCKNNHSEGCWKSGLLWVENCRPGYRHVVGFCEKKDIDCEGMGLMPGRIANSCAKRTYGRKPVLPGCGSGKEYDAGLCYNSCGPTADGVGPVCWGHGPPGWVQCGAGWAKDTKTCNQNITSQVFTVFDAALSTGTLVLSMGASAAVKKGLTKGLQGALKGVKHIGKAQLKTALKSYAATSLPTVAGDFADGGVDFIWDMDDILNDPNMTDVEKDHAIAQLTLKNINLLDPTGVTGVLAAYTKPICKDIAASNPPPAGVQATSGGLATIMDNSEQIEEGIKQRIQRARETVVTKQANMIDAMNKSITAKTTNQPPEVLEQSQQAIEEAQRELTAAQEELQLAQRSLEEFRSLKLGRN